MAAGSKPVEEFRVYDVQLPESGGQGLWLGHRCVECESVDCGFAAGRFHINSARIDRCKPVRLHDTAVIFREFATESDRAVGRPAVIAKREPTVVIAEREPAFLFTKRQSTVIVTKRKPTVVITKRKPAQFIRVIRRKRVQRRKRRQVVNASGELSWSGESRRRRRVQRWRWWASLKQYKIK